MCEVAVAWEVRGSKDERVSSHLIVRMTGCSAVQPTQTDLRRSTMLDQRQGLLKESTCSGRDPYMFFTLRRSTIAAMNSRLRSTCTKCC